MPGEWERPYPVRVRERIGGTASKRNTTSASTGAPSGDPVEALVKARVRKDFAVPQTQRTEDEGKVFVARDGNEGCGARHHARKHGLDLERVSGLLPPAVQLGERCSSGSETDRPRLPAQCRRLATSNGRPPIMEPDASN